MLRKLISMVLALLLCLTCLVFSASAETVTVNFYRLGGNVTCSYADAEMVDDAINEYIEPLIGIKIKTTIFHNNDELQMALAAQEDIDIYFDCNWYDAIDCDNMVKANGVMDITDLLPNYPALVNAIPETIWESTKYNGRNYFVPNYKESAEGVSLVCNKAVADELGWTEEELTAIHDYKTLETYLAQAKEAGVEVPFITVAIDDDGAYLDGKKLGADAFEVYYPYAVINKNGDTTKFVIPTEDPDYIEWAKTVYEWNMNGYMTEDFGIVGVDNSELTSVLNNGNWAFSTWTTIPDTDGQIKSQFDFDYILIPYSKNWISSSSALGSAFAIHSNSQKAEAALKFLEILNTDPIVADLFIYGIEGVHYTRTEDGRIHQLPQAAAAYENATWKGCSVMNASVLDVERSDKADLYATFNENGISTPSNGFRFDSSEVDTYLAALDNVANEYAGLIDRGATDPDEAIAAYNAALKAAGIDNVIAEMQKQYDEWMANGK